jgi:hypothetical protein
MKKSVVKWSAVKCSHWFWITLPKNHFIEIFWPKGNLIETPFDRTPFDRKPFDRKYIWPNRRLTESRSTENSFYRKKSFGRKKIIKRSFDRKYDQMIFSVKWPFGQMTFRSNDLSVKWPLDNELSVKWPFAQKFSVKRFFGKVIQNRFQLF